MSKSRKMVVSVIFGVLMSLAVAVPAMASLIYVAIPVPTTPCDFVVEGDVDTRLTPPAWAHAGFVCSG